MIQGRDEASLAREIGTDCGIDLAQLAVPANTR
jgi:hypothetical protein